MSFANAQRADPHTHFRAAPGYRGPHQHGGEYSAIELKERFGSVDRWEVFRDWMRQRPPETVTTCPRGCALFSPHDVAEFEGRS